MENVLLGAYQVLYNSFLPRRRSLYLSVLLKKILPYITKGMNFQVGFQPDRKKQEIYTPRKEEDEKMRTLSIVVLLIGVVTLVASIISRIARSVVPVFGGMWPITGVEFAKTCFLLSIALILLEEKK